MVILLNVPTLLENTLYISIFYLDKKNIWGFKEKIGQHLCVFTLCINMHQSDQCCSAVLMSGIHIKMVKVRKPGVGTVLMVNGYRSFGPEDSDLPR